MYESYCILQAVFYYSFVFILCDEMERYQGFYLEGEKGNNCFTYGERGENSRLRVPKLIS